jgi:RNA polymerase sigma-70 factor (sigma-E family)
VSSAPADLERFCATEFPRLVRMLDLLTGDVHLAEELAQEALVRTSSHWSKVSTMDAPGAWTRRVARNLATSSWRRAQAARRAAARVGPDATVHHDRDVAERDAVNEALQKLDQRDREVLVLRHHLQLTVAETATELGISAEAVKSRSHRAAGRLRTLLDNDTEEARR